MNSAVREVSEQQRALGETEGGASASRHGKRQGAPSVWLSTETGEVLRLPLYGESDPAGAVHLLVTTSSDSGDGGTREDALRAASLLMPNLSPELIAEALEW